jgi:hypothetical protein
MGAALASQKATPYPTLRRNSISASCAKRIGPFIAAKLSSALDSPKQRLIDTVVYHPSADWTSTVAPDFSFFNLFDEAGAPLKRKQKKKVFPAFPPPASQVPWSAAG